MTVMFGTNDWGQSRSIGTINDFNENGEYVGSFMGSLNTFCKNVKELFPDKVIIYVTPPFASQDCDYNGQLFFDEGQKNLQGLTVRDYCNAIIEVCKKWDIPCFDFNAKAEWNTNNKDSFLTAEPNNTYVHPNWNGAEVYARYLAEYCKLFK